MPSLIPEVLLPYKLNYFPLLFTPIDQPGRVVLFFFLLYAIGFFLRPPFLPISPLLIFA